MSSDFSASDLQEVEAQIGYCFQNKELLKSALTHASYTTQFEDKKTSPDRLEFLGSSVMNLIISDRAFEKLVQLNEGGLRRVRSKLLRDETCVLYFQNLNLQKHVKMSSSERSHIEEIGNDRLMTKIVLTLVGAIYKDGGFDFAAKFLNSKCLPAAKPILKDKHYSNWRKKLQELCHAKMRKQPTYVLLSEEGPDHSKIYKVGVFMDEDLLAKGTGKSKKIAATNAASLAIEKIQ